MAGSRKGKTYEPTDDERETVKLMVAAGIPVKRIAKVKGMSDNTLRKHFAREIETGHDEVTTRIADSLVRKAESGDTTAMIFYLKTQGGWKEAQKVEHSGPDGAPIQTQTTIDPGKLDDDTLAKLMAAKHEGSEA